jgi:hypothetical protein
MRFPPALRNNSAIYGCQSIMRMKVRLHLFVAMQAMIPAPDGGPDLIGSPIERDMWVETPREDSNEILHGQ